MFCLPFLDLYRVHHSFYLCIFFLSLWTLLLFNEPGCLTCFPPQNRCSSLFSKSECSRCYCPFVWSSRTPTMAAILSVPCVSVLSSKRFSLWDLKVVQKPVSSWHKFQQSNVLLTFPFEKFFFIGQTVNGSLFPNRYIKSCSASSYKMFSPKNITVLAKVWLLNTSCMVFQRAAGVHWFQLWFSIFGL